jgi:hypothetical protein
MKRIVLSSDFLTLRYTLEYYDNLLIKLVFNICKIILIMLP